MEMIALSGGVSSRREQPRQESFIELDESIELIRCTLDSPLSPAQRRYLERSIDLLSRHRIGAQANLS